MLVLGVHVWNRHYMLCILKGGGGKATLRLTAIEEVDGLVKISQDNHNKFECFLRGRWHSQEMQTAPLPIKPEAEVRTAPKLE